MPTPALARPAEAARAVSEHGRHSLSAFAVEDDKRHLVAAGGRGVVAYVVRGPVALAAGDPLCAEANREACTREWLEHCRRSGWTPCIYEAADESLELFRRVGLRALKMGEEAIVDLGSFSLAGGPRAALRSMVHKATRLGLVVRRYDRARNPDPGVDAQLEQISEAWLREKRQREMGFSLGRFSLPSLDDAFVFLCLDAERVVAFTSWRSYRGVLRLQEEPVPVQEEVRAPLGEPLPRVSGPRRAAAEPGLLRRRVSTARPTCRASPGAEPPSPPGTSPGTLRCW